MHCRLAVGGIQPRHLLVVKELQDWLLATCDFAAQAGACSLQDVASLRSLS